MSATTRQSDTISGKPKPRRKRKTYPARSNGKHPGGRPTAYSPQLAQEICALVAQGNSLSKACDALRLAEPTVYRWVSTDPQFREDLLRARDVRADIAFAEQVLDIADNTSDDRVYNAKTGKLTVSKEAVLRSRVRIEMRQWQMQRRHPLKWGERQQIEVKDDFSRLTIQERMQKVAELLSLRPGD